jgi:steroid delta-isomerase-like uncharacterized protein
MSALSADEHKATARRLVEAWNGAALELLDEIVAPDYLFHDPADPTMPRGPEGAKQQIRAFRTAFPDLHLTIEDEIAEGDKVVQRLSATGTHQGPLLGIPPTGKAVRTSSIEVMRIAEGKIAEHWDELDLLGLLQQLGAIPTPGTSQ